MKKRTLSVIIAICLLMTFALTTAFAVGNTNSDDTKLSLDAEEPGFLTGDVDGNGVVASKDAVMIQKYLAGIIDLDYVQKSVVDTNGDGKINIFDATRVQKYVAGVIDEF